MRKIRLLSLVCLMALSAVAQYSMDGCIVSGGGTSTSGVFSVTGAIGQHDATGPMTNGQYSVIGGFWALPVAVQIANGPTLSIVPAARGFATLSWTPPTPGFILQESRSLSPPSWTNAPSGATNPVVVAVLPSPKFYRLFKP